MPSAIRHRPMITAIVLTLNEEEHLPDCLASLAWADEVVVFDSFSTDSTVEIADKAGARVIQYPFENYAAQRNAALEAVPKAEWVLFVDADERIPSPLAEEVREVIRAGNAVAGWIPRHNYIFGRLTLHTGWYPDYQQRLLLRNKVRYDPDRHVHELAVVDGPDIYLTQPMIHLNYATAREFIEKQYRYTEYDANMLFREGKRARPHNFVFQPLRQFWWRFVTLQGWRDGFHGLRLSVLTASFELEKYRLLRKLQIPNSKSQIGTSV